MDFSADDRIFCGKLEGIDDSIKFEGSTVEELESAFRFMVELPSNCYLNYLISGVHQCNTCNRYMF